jgi:ABC-type transporter Mla subunit MlaD
VVAKQQQWGDLEMASSEQTDKLTQSISSTLSEMGEKSKAVAGDALEKASASTSQFGAGLAETLREGAETQKNAGADAVTTLARSARNAADDLENKSPEVARLVRSSANVVERVSTDLRNQSLADLVDATSNFAVRHPVAFFGCGVLAGFVAARLLSPPQR